MTLKEFKSGELMFSFFANDTEEAINKISKSFYYGSVIYLTMFREDKGNMFFYVVNYKGEISYKSVVVLNTKTNRGQLRIFI